MPRTLPISRARTYWTRQRVVAALSLFYRTHGFAPTSTEDWHCLVKDSGKTTGRDFPSFYAVLRWFNSFREAWAAAGILTDRSHEPWDELEEWYLREAIGIIPRVEIGRDLRRSEGSVKRRMYDLGIDARTHWGWPINRVEEHLQVPANTLQNFMEHGDLPFFRGHLYIYIDPADLVGLPGITWRHATKEIRAAARKSLMERAAKILAGQDWRAGRIYQPRATRRRRNRRQGVRPEPQPFPLKRGDIVEVVVRAPNRDVRRGRRGIVHLVHWVSGWTIRRGDRPGWFARVEFKKDKRHGRNTRRVTYAMPLSCLKRVRRRPDDPAFRRGDTRSRARATHMEMAAIRRTGKKLPRRSTYERQKRRLDAERKRIAKRDIRREKAETSGEIFRGRSSGVAQTVSLRGSRNR